MKLELSDIEYIKNAFNKMQTINDFIDLLNYAKKIAYGKNNYPFTIDQIKWYTKPHIRSKSYKKFDIQKKSGKSRTINAPIKGLKSIQKLLNIILQCVFEPHKYAFGFTQNKSIVDNAKLHTGKRYVYNIDLKDFFPSIDQGRVWACLQLPPFNLNGSKITQANHFKWVDFKEKLVPNPEKNIISLNNRKLAIKTLIGLLFVSKNFNPKKESFVILGDEHTKTKNGKTLKDTMWLSNTIPYTSNKEICNIIASLCCTDLEVERKDSEGNWIKVTKSVLPQGAPTSPTITNIVCQRLDFILTGIAKRFGLSYSRYADDITFSSMHNVYQPNSEFLIELERTISEQGFTINEVKTRLQKDGYKKTVTGLLVNDKVNVEKQYIKQLRMWLYYWETYGYNRASQYFINQYAMEKGTSKTKMENVISGKLDYLKMVKGSENNIYQKLLSRYNTLINHDYKGLINKTEKLDTIITVLIKKGLNEAMKLYK